MIGKLLGGGLMGRRPLSVGSQPVVFPPLPVNLVLEADANFG